jgi:hypothetical protein
MRRRIYREKSPAERGAAAASRHAARGDNPFRRGTPEYYEWRKAYDARQAQLDRHEADEWNAHYGRPQI